MDENTDLPAVVGNGESHRLDPRWIPYQRQVAALKSAVNTLVLIGAALLGALLGDLPAAPLVVVAAVLAVIYAGLKLWWPGPAWRHASYRLGARSLEIRRGVLWRKWIEVPRSRIQHSDVSQGPLERLHGLGTLSVYTAGTAHALVRLHGLDHARALAIRDHLMQSDEADVV
jgi:membrane protein YdbS with pleckstrin-like domain